MVELWNGSMVGIRVLLRFLVGESPTLSGDDVSLGVEACANDSW
jgi:hypothetical protein